MAKDQPASKEKTICQKIINVVATSPASRSGRRTNLATSDSSLHDDHKLPAVTPSGMPHLAKSHGAKASSEVPIMFDHPMNEHNQLTVKDGRQKIVPPAVPKVAGPTATTQLVNSWGEVATGVSDHQEKVVPAKAQGKPKKKEDLVPEKKNEAPKDQVSPKPFMEARARDTGKKKEGFQGKGGEEGKKLLPAKTDDFNDYIDRAGARIRTTTLAGDGRKPIIAKDSLHGRINDFITRAKHKFHRPPSDVDSSATRTVIR